MNNIQLLDCTLRDGGYINDWRFGEKAIPDMVQKLVNTNVEIFEIGFLKNEPYQKNRTVFQDVEQIVPLISPKKNGTKYAAMIEVVNPLPLEQLKPCTGDSVDIIRVIVWKTKHNKVGQLVDALEEGFSYCKGVVEKGYKLCVQPARVDQYSDTEFVEMIRKFSTLNPLAIYVVDSWGTQNPESLLHYMHLADKNMPNDIALGYHGHNNMMQTLPAAQAMLKEGFVRDLFVDASVYGIGRGAGNLNLEIIAKYLNEQYDKRYNIEPILDVYDEYVRPIYEIEKWGYSIPYYLTAKYNCNPNYADYYSKQFNLKIFQFEEMIKEMSPEDRVIFKKSN